MDFITVALLVAFILVNAAFILLLGIAWRRYTVPAERERLPAYVLNAPPPVEGKFNQNHLPPRKNYSIFSRMISGLGNLLNGSARYFNLAVKIMGAFLVPIGLYIGARMQPGLLVLVGTIGFVAGGVGLFLLGFFPTNRQGAHKIVAVIAFGGFLVACGAWLLPMSSGPIGTTATWILNLAPLVAAVYHGHASRYFDQQEELTDTRPAKLSRNYNFSEWLLFLTTWCWVVVTFLVYAILSP